MTGFMVILTIMVFTSTSFMQMILTFEALSLYFILSIILSSNNFSEGSVLILFSLSILEGVLSIYGIITLMNYSGMDFMLGMGMGA